ncbi:MAG TPA: NAD(P)H-hydrate dehydratase [Pyrinomonadaceae bacterium]|nr:NAD(P)H-hydrate dehydratase [Pyrinomonadaceae bacterium]
MQKVLTAAEMREVDRLTTERYGIPSIILMENAAHAVARVITEKLGGSVKGKSILILCGKGNNGGDGAALARILSAEAAIVYVILYGVGLVEAKGDARINFDRIIGAEFQDKINFVEANEYWKAWEYLNKTDWDGLSCLVDAVFGTGLKYFDDALNEILSSFEDTLHIAVDIPTGLFADKASVKPFQFKADVTVTFTAPKIGNLLPPASNFNGELVVAEIGSPQELIDEQGSQLFLAENKDAGKWLELTKFSDSSYKNKRGHALLIAGSENYSGAAVLAGNAGMRSGVGLVTLVTPRTSKESVAARVLPEVMVRGVAETASGAISGSAYDEIGDLLEKADAVAIGCGLSQDESTKRFVQKVIENRRQPVVVDADALNLLAPFDGEAANGASDAPLILTPHEGEFLRLLGTDDKDAIKDRVAAVREFSQKHNVILVLKGERVLIGEPGGKVVVNPTGNSGLGKAGNGDTLTGILAGFTAQAAAMNIDIFETVVAAVYVAGLAGDIAEKKYGKRVMTASDVRECLTEAFAAVAC